ncbi:hypothetical protein [[Eubacterium] cellulosolvens]
MTEQNQIYPQAITFENFEKYLRSTSMDQLIAHVNGLYQAMVYYVRQTAAHIWFIGRALIREKEIVGHGNWMSHCRHFHSEISIDSIERYMKVGKEIPIDQLPILLDKTPSQAYQMLEIKKKRSLPTKQNNVKSNSANLRKFPKGFWASGLGNCPHCDGLIWFTFEENRIKMWSARS